MPIVDAYFAFLPIAQVDVQQPTYPTHNALGALDPTHNALGALDLPHLQRLGASHP